MTDLRTAVADAVRDHVAPAMGLDPADIDVVAVDDGIASLRLGGACAGCPATIPPMLMQLEAELKRHVPAVEFVEAVGGVT